jgi:hypothetical protein
VLRTVVTEARAHRLQKRRVGEQHRVTVHARLGRRNSRERRRFHGGMAVRRDREAKAYLNGVGPHASMTSNGLYHSCEKRIKERRSSGFLPNCRFGWAITR